MRGCAPAPQLGRDGQLKLQENPKGWAKEPEWRTIRISINKSKTTADRINPWFTVVFKISRCQRREFLLYKQVYLCDNIITLSALFLQGENNMKYQKLFTPVKVGSITLKNRFAMAPMGPLGLAVL